MGRRSLLILAAFACARVAFCGQLPIELTPVERERSIARLEAVRRRLVAGNVIPDEPPRGVRWCLAWEGLHSRMRIPVVDVGTDQLSATFAREDGTLLRLVERPQSAARSREEELGESHVFALSVERAAQLTSDYLAAVEGHEPPGPGRLDSYSLSHCVDPDGSPRRVLPTQTLYAAWPRGHGGFAFRDDEINLAISAVDGAFLSYGRYHISEPPPTVKVAITRDEALALAKAAGTREVVKQTAFGELEPEDVVPEGTLLGSKAAYERALEWEREKMRSWAADFKPFVEVEPGVEDEPTLMIVNPNEQLIGRHTDDDRHKWNPQTRLAWVAKLVFKAPEGAEGAWRRLHMEIWIDAENGEVLGGELPY